MQNEYANQLRGQAAPQGRRVGPSNIYVAPNWGESLQYAVNQGLGGYMAGKARRASEDLDSEKNAVLQAKIEQERSDIERGFDFKERDLGLRQAAAEESKRAALVKEMNDEADLDLRFAKENYDRLDERTRQGEVADEIAETARLAREKHEYKMELERLKQSGKTPKLTESQATNRGYFSQSIMAHEKLLELENDGMAIKPEGVAAFLQFRGSPIAGTVVRQYLSAKEGRYLDLLLDSGLVKLRDDSGAALPDTEIATQMFQLIPVTTDSSKQRADRQDRRTVMLDKYFLSGGKWSDEEIADYEKKKAQWASEKKEEDDPLGIR